MFWYGLGIQRILRVVVMLLYKGSGDDTGLSQNYPVHSLSKTKYAKRRAKRTSSAFHFHIEAPFVLPCGKTELFQLQLS